MVSHPIYNHLTQSTEPGPVLTFHTLGRPTPMSDKTLAKVQNGDFFALARSIAQATGSMPLIQGSQWPTMQDTLKNITCDHWAFSLPSDWVPTAMLTGHEPAIHEALVKQIG